LPVSPKKHPRQKKPAVTPLCISRLSPASPSPGASREEGLSSRHCARTHQYNGIVANHVSRSLSVADIVSCIMEIFNRLGLAISFQ
jgi:hypothetical protein